MWLSHLHRIFNMWSQQNPMQQQKHFVILELQSAGNKDQNAISLPIICCTDMLTLCIPCTNASIPFLISTFTFFSSSNMFYSFTKKNMFSLCKFAVVITARSFVSQSVFTRQLLSANFCLQAPARIELAIPGLQDQCTNHWAIEPNAGNSLRYE